MATTNGNHGVDLAALEVDPRAEDEGEWIDCPEFGTDAEGNAVVAFKVRSDKCPAFEKLRAKLSRTLHKQYAASQYLNPTLLAQVTAQCLLDVGLLGWRGLAQGGEDLPFTPENAKMILTDRRYRKIRDAIAAACQAVGDRESKWREDLGKASSASSNGA